MSESAVRPKVLVGVVGTGTEVGKTWVTSAIIRELRTRGHRVAARKPAQSFDAGAADTDADALARATEEAPHVICPPHRCYPVAMAPPMAADVLNRERILVADLIHETRWTADLDYGFVETAGGARSPLADDADSIDLLQRMSVDEYLLVADAGLGTINSLRLTLACIQDSRVLVYLNRFDPGNGLHWRNLEWLSSRDQMRIVASPQEWCDYPRR